jgi:hypothetical protein
MLRKTITSAEVPLVLPKTMMNLDSFHLSYLMASGRVAIASPADAARLIVAKYEKSRIPGWWPESVLISQLLKKACKTRLQEVLKDVFASFDLSKETVDPVQAIAALKKIPTGESEKLLAQLRDLTGKIAKKSSKFFAAQFKTKAKKELPEAWAEYLGLKSADQLKMFYDAYPDRILHKEVERLIEIMQTSPEMRKVSMDDLQARMIKVSENAPYWDGLTRHEAAWEWNAQGIAHGHARGVETYMIVNPLDHLTCPVCLRMHGTEFSTTKAMGLIKKRAEITDPDQLVSEFPFPRVNDIDRLDASERADTDFTQPPFHNHCRCQVVYATGSWVAPEEEILPPGAEGGNWGQKISEMDQLEAAFEIRNKYLEENGISSEEEPKYRIGMRFADMIRELAKLFKDEEGFVLSPRIQPGSYGEHEKNLEVLGKKTINVIDGTFGFGDQLKSFTVTSSMDEATHQKFTISAADGFSLSQAKSLIGAVGSVAETAAGSQVEIYTGVMPKKAALVGPDVFPDVAWKIGSAEYGAEPPLKPESPKIGLPKEPVWTIPGGLSEISIPPVEELTRKESAQRLGGAHPKEIYVDKDGNEFMFKPSRSGWTAYAEQAASEIGKIAGLNVATVKVVELDGRRGTIQWLRADIDREATSYGVLDKTKYLPQVVKQQVLDWFIGNFDSHQDQWLVTKSGEVVGVDKGQAFKYLGKEKLSTDYHPNEKYGSRPPIYNEIMPHMDDYTRRGKVDLQESWEVIQKLQAIPKKTLESLLLPYAEGLVASGQTGSPKTVNAFINSLVKKQKTLATDFEKFYSSILGEPFRFSKKPIEGEAAPSWPKRIPTGESLFSEKIASSAYDQAVLAHKDFTPEELLEKWRNTYRDPAGSQFGWNAIAGGSGGWAFSTLRPGGMHIKIMARELEGSKGALRFNQRAGNGVFRDVADIYDGIAKTRASLLERGVSPALLTPEAYAEIRALGQLYLAKTISGKTKVLRRGTDGRTGIDIRSRIVNTRYDVKIDPEFRVTFQEDAVVGYSADKKVADSFGKKFGGITVKRRVPLRDIILPPEFFALSSEKEYLVLVRDAISSYKLSEVEYR